MSVSLDTVAILGVGLIGGSLGMAVRTRRLARVVIGHGRSSQRLDEAVRRGAIDRGTLDLAEAVGQANLIVVCTPVGRIAQDVAEASRLAPSQAAITDAGSTKATILDGVTRLAPEARFVGAHPIAGSEKSGVAHARADLMDGRVCVLTPGPEATSELVAEVQAFWEAVGMDVRLLDAETHDQALAYTSHLPHVVAAALANSLPQAWRDLTGSGFRDTARVAAGEADLWRDILLENRGSVLTSLEQYLAVLNQFHDALSRGDASAVVEFLREAKRSRDALGS